MMLKTLHKENTLLSDIEKGGETHKNWNNHSLNVAFADNQNRKVLWDPRHISAKAVSIAKAVVNILFCLLRR